MRKLLSFLSICITYMIHAQGGVFQYSPIWTYTGSNISYTNGSVICGSLTTAGTLSVGSTATVTGNARITGSLLVTGQSSIGVGQNNYMGALVSSQVESTGNMYADTKLRIGGVTTPTSNLDVTGTGSISSTFTVAGQTVLQNTTNIIGLSTISTQSTVTLTTPASSGTLANLSDAVWAQWIGAGVVGGGSSPADGTSYFLGNCNAWNAAATNVSLTIPYNCTLIGYNAVAFVNGTIGSAENVTLAIMGTTNYTLTTTMTYSLGGANATSTTGISQNFNAGDLFYIRQFSPTWATNPTQVAIGITLYFVRRQ